MIAPVLSSTIKARDIVPIATAVPASNRALYSLEGIASKVKL